MRPPSKSHPHPRAALTGWPSVSASCAGPERINYNPMNMTIEARFREEAKRRGYDKALTEDFVKKGLEDWKKGDKTKTFDLGLRKSSKLTSDR